MHVVRESNISDNVKENYKYDRVNADNNEDSSMRHFVVHNGGRRCFGCSVRSPLLARL